MACSERLEAERKRFDDVRKAESEYHRTHGTPAFIKDHGDWILFGPQDIREASKKYLFCLQKLKSQKTPRVRVGCHYYTLAQAWKHWSPKAKTGRSGRERWGFTSRKNEGKQAIAIIRLMLLQAQAYGLISKWHPVPKFDATLLQPKRKT